MLLEMTVCALAAAGVVLLLWCLLGALLLPAAGPGLAAVYRCGGDAPALERTVRAFVWLRESGLTEMELTVVDCGMSPQALARARALAARHGYIRIDTEESQVEDGNRTDPRQCGRGGLSE